MRENSINEDLESEIGQIRESIEKKTVPYHRPILSITDDRGDHHSTPFETTYQGASSELNVGIPYESS